MHAAALRFAAMLLRLQDFALLSPERVQNTFREDVTRQDQGTDRQPRDGVGE